MERGKGGKNVTRPELVNKLLLTIDTLITQVNESNDPALVAGLGDKLAKLSAVIEKLDKKANVVDVIEVFMAFSKWIEYRSTIDPEVTPELVRAINKYQDLYITEQMGINKTAMATAAERNRHTNSGRNTVKECSPSRIRLCSRARHRHKRTGVFCVCRVTMPRSVNITSPTFSPCVTKPPGKSYAPSTMHRSTMRQRLK